MGYELALEAAGADIEESKSFGSYQADAYFRVKLLDGRRGWLCISYGSCSGCDSFKAEFGFDTSDGHDHAEYYYDWAAKPVKGCDRCEALQKKLKDFGEQYLDGLMTQEEAEKAAAENIGWDEEAEEVLKFVKDNTLNSSGRTLPDNEPPSAAIFPQPWW